MISDPFKRIVDRIPPPRSLFENDPEAAGRPRGRSPGFVAEPPPRRPPPHATILLPEVDWLAGRIRDKRGNGEVIAENARTVRAALKTSDLTGLARTHAAAVRDAGDGALAELADFCSQLHKADPAACNRWRQALKKELPAETERMGRALNLVNLENAAEGDQDALKALNDELREALSTVRPPKEGEVRTAFAPLAIPVGAHALRMALPLLLGAPLAKEAREQLEELFTRTDIAEPLPTTETIPEDRPDPKGDTETLPPSEQLTIDPEPETLPDQSDAFDDGTIVEYHELDNPIDLTKCEVIHPDTEDALQRLGKKQADALRKTVLGSGRVNGADRNGANIVSGESADILERDYERAARAYGVDPYGPMSKRTYDKEGMPNGRRVIAPDDTRIIWQMTGRKEGPTLEIQFPMKPSDGHRYTIKKRYGEN